MLWIFNLWKWCEEQVRVRTSVQWLMDGIIQWHSAAEKSFSRSYRDLARCKFIHGLFLEWILLFAKLGRKYYTETKDGQSRCPNYDYDCANNATSPYTWFFWNSYPTSFHFFCLSDVHSTFVQNSLSNCLRKREQGQGKHANDGTRRLCILVLLVCLLHNGEFYHYISFMAISERYSQVFAQV